MADGTITEAEFLTWVPARDARHDLQKTLYDTTSGEIVRRAAAGLLTARLEKGFVTKRGQTGALIPYGIVGEAIWKQLVQIGHISHNNLWTTNGLQITLSAYHDGDKKYDLYGIRFDPAGLDAIVPKRVIAPKPPTTGDLAAITLAPAPAPKTAPLAQPAPAAPAPAPPPAITTPPLISIDPKDRRGPSPKDFWDDMLIAVFKRIYEGWQPDRLADVEKAMHEWLASKGRSAGERTVRNVAKKVFEALKD